MAIYTQANRPQSEMTAEPSKYPQGYFRPKPCRHCEATFSPNAPSHLFCSQRCSDSAHNTAYLRRHYGIDEGQWFEMFKEQDGRCKICLGDGFKMIPTAKQTLVVDHCHATGVVRGLLCHNCNRALGLLQDDIRSIERAAEYLKVQRPSREGVEPSGSKRTTPNA